MQVSRLKKKVRPSLPSIFDSLPDDLVIEILLRLPIKHLNRCKCVSKRWSYLISTPYFIRCYVEYRKATVTRSFCMFYQPSKSGPKPHTVSVAYTKNKLKKLFKNTTGFSLKFMSVPVRVVSSNNGLVLCSSNKAVHNMYYVCNPLTKSWITIPPPPSARLWARVGFICKPLDLDACSCSFVIVRLVNHSKRPNPCVITVETYSSETGQWVKYVDLIDVGKHLNNQMLRSYLLRIRQPHAVICKGLLHWAGVSHIFVYDPTKTTTTTTSKVNSELCSCPISCKYLTLVNAKGISYTSISSISLSTHGNSRTIYHNNGEWEILHKVCLDQIRFYQSSLRILFDRRIDKKFRLAFHPFNEDIIFICVPPRVLSCNMRTKTLHLVCHVPYNGKHFVDDWISYLVVLPWWPLRLVS